MAKLVLTDIANILTATNAINGNNEAIEVAVENTLSRDGTGPNEMNANLDMNEYRIYNLPEPVDDNDAVRKVDVDGILAGLPSTFLPPDKATQAEAEAGVNNVKWMTPLRTAQAIAALTTSISPTKIIGVANRAALAALNTTNYKAAAVYGEGGRNGLFLLDETDRSAAVTVDTTQAVYVAPTASPTGTSGAWVRDRTPKTLDLEWFGVSTAVTNNQPAIAAAIAFANTESGGTIYCGGSYPVTTEVIISGSDITFLCLDQSSGFMRTTAGRVLKVTGSRHAVLGGLFYQNVFTSTATDYTIWLENAVGCNIERNKIQGGYYCLAITGGACSDNTYEKNSFLYATGPSMVYVADSTNGVNGAHHFFRNTHNQPYPVSSPNGTTTFKGSRANSTAYAVGDIVSSGNYYLQCRVAGTSAVGAPTVNVWYFVDIADGATLKWRLVARNDYSGIVFDTNTYYSVVRESDFTGPFQYSIRTRNSLAGDAPNDIMVERCTLHGPVSVGVYIESGNNILINNIDGWNGSDNTATTYGVLNTGGNCVRVVNPGLYGFDVGVQNNVPTSSVIGGSITGCASGISVGNNVNTFTIQGVHLGASTLGGANTVPVTIGTGCDYYSVVNNMFVGASSGISNGSSGAANKTVSGNW